MNSKLPLKKVFAEEKSLFGFWTIIFMFTYLKHSKIPSELKINRIPIPHNIALCLYA